MEENNQDFEIQESNAAKKMRLLGMDMNDKIHSEEDEITKGKLWSNIWYRYKWVIIIGGILLITAIILIVQLAMKKENDVKIGYAGPAYLAEAETRNSLQEILNTIAKDYNDDGEVMAGFYSSVILNSIQLTEKDENGKEMGADQKYQNQQMLSAFSQQMMSGDFTLYLLDPVLYEENFKGLFRDVEKVYGGEIPDSIKYDDYAVYLKKTEFGRYFKGFDKLPDNTILLVLEKTHFASDKEYEDSLDYFKQIIDFKVPT